MVIILQNGHNKSSFKSLLKLFVFHIALFSLSSYEEIVEQSRLFNHGIATDIREGKLNSNLLNCLKTDLVSHPEGFINIHIRGVCGIMVTIRGNGHGDLSSNPCLGCLHFT